MFLLLHFRKVGHVPVRQCHGGVRVSDLPRTPGPPVHFPITSISCSYKVVLL